MNKILEKQEQHRQRISQFNKKREGERVQIYRITNNNKEIAIDTEKNV